jgi:hypothetical protein
MSIVSHFAENSAINLYDFLLEEFFIYNTHKYYGQYQRSRVSNPGGELGPLQLVGCHPDTQPNGCRSRRVCAKSSSLRKTVRKTGAQMFRLRFAPLNMTIPPTYCFFQSPTGKYACYNLQRPDGYTIDASIERFQIPTGIKTVETIYMVIANADPCMFQIPVGNYAYCNHLQHYQTHIQLCCFKSLWGSMPLAMCGERRQLCTDEAVSNPRGE